MLRALQKLGWTEAIAPRHGSHRKLIRPDRPEPYIWAFHDSEEVGPKMLARIGKQTGLRPEDL